MDYIEKISGETIYPVADMVEYIDGAVASLCVANKAGVNVTYFAFDAGEQLSTHKAPGDAFVMLLEGRGHVIIDGTQFDLKAGEGIVMPSGKPHSVHADERMKMQLILLKA